MFTPVFADAWRTRPPPQERRSPDTTSAPSQIVRQVKMRAALRSAEGRRLGLGSVERGRLGLGLTARELHPMLPWLEQAQPQKRRASPALPAPSPPPAQLA